MTRLRLSASNCTQRSRVTDRSSRVAKKFRVRPRGKCDVFHQSLDTRKRSLPRGERKSETSRPTFRDEFLQLLWPPRHPSLIIAGRPTIFINLPWRNQRKNSPLLNANKSNRLSMQRQNCDRYITILSKIFNETFKIISSQMYGQIRREKKRRKLKWHSSSAIRCKIDDRGGEAFIVARVSARGAVEGQRRDNGVRFNKANVTIVKEGSVRRLARKLTRVGEPVVSRYYAGNSYSWMALGERGRGWVRYLRNRTFSRISSRWKIRFNLSIPPLKLEILVKELLINSWRNYSILITVSIWRYWTSLSNERWKDDWIRRKKRKITEAVGAS